VTFDLGLRVLRSCANVNRAVSARSLSQRVLTREDEVRRHEPSDFSVVITGSGARNHARRLRWSPRRRAPTSVSVVINTFNRRELLKRTLVSLREQTYRPFEVIVVNGPSTDGTDEFLASFRGRVRRTNCPEAHLGLSRNLGIRIAAGEIVAFIDDDAIPRSDWLEQLVSCYQDSGVSAAGGPVFDIPLDRPVWTLCTSTRLGVVETECPGPLESYLQPAADPFAYLPGCNMSFKRELLAEVGGFNELLTYNYDDVEVCARIVDRGYRFAIFDDVLVTHARAPNAFRDAQRVLFDPYPTFYCRTVFAMHCNQAQKSPDEIAATIRASMDGDQRVQDAIQDGMDAASKPRVDVSFDSVPRSEFLCYR
jgi:GT2 family glycosyltransferase